MQWAEIQALGGVGRADRLLKAAGYNGAYKTVEISRWAKWNEKNKKTSTFSALERWIVSQGIYVRSKSGP